MTHWLGVCVGIAAAIAVMPATEAFDLQGHRGARGLAPENTLAAFRVALRIGVTTIETDVAVTRDGVPVLSHDAALNPALVRDASGRWLTAPGPAIRALTLQELAQYDIGRLDPVSRYAKDFPLQRPVDGERFPTLDALLALVAHADRPVRVNLETKVTPDDAGKTADVTTFVRPIIEAVRRANLVDRVTIQSFDWRALVEAKRLEPRIETSCLTIESSNMNTMATRADGRSPWHAGRSVADYGGSVPKLVQATGCATWSMFWRNLTPALVVEAHALGLKVLPWTVNDPAEMRRLIDLGVDGIITDYPDRL